MRKRNKRISSSDLQYLIAFIMTAILITSGVAYIALNPPPTDQFFAMYVLGSRGLAANYYPGDSPDIGVGEQVNWTLRVYNHMGSLQYIVVQVKLLNATLTSPNETTGQPSPVLPMLEFRRALVDNETWSLPFVWKVLNVTSDGDSSQITSLFVNGFVLKGNLAKAVSGNDYRFIFELWFYDSKGGTLSFTWVTNGRNESVWNQIWFNSPATHP